MWRRRSEGGSGLGTHVHLWWIHVDVWQNKYNIVKEKKIIINFKKEKKSNFSIVSGTSNTYSVAFSIRLGEKKKKT